MANPVEPNTIRRALRASQALWVPAAAGVLAASIAGGWACFHSMRRMTPASLMGLAVGYVLLAIIAGLIGFVCARILYLRGGPPCLRHSLLGSMLIASWAPAFALHLESNSRWALLPASLASVVWTIAARSHAASTSGLSPLRFAGAQLEIAILSAPELMGWSSTAREMFAASLLLQSSAAIAFAGEPRWAVGPAILACTLLAGSWYDMKAGAAQACVRLRGCETSFITLCAAAVAVTAVALLPHLETRIAATGSSSEQPADPPLASTVGEQTIDNDVHEGVILWPEEQRKITLVPPLPRLGPSLGSSRTADSLNIPFFGAYWIYRSPHTQPPPGSLVLRGTPVQRKLHSTDRVRLKMEARQNLGTFFPIDCCGDVQLHVTNSDAYFGTIALEVLLRDTGSPGKPQQSLGKQVLPDSGRGPRGFMQLSQSLSFTVPSSGLLRNFDEIIVVFHLAPFRADRAARVSIDRFVLMPRGR